MVGENLLHVMQNTPVYTCTHTKTQTHTHTHTELTIDSNKQ